jgi:hypothetical protein
MTRLRTHDLAATSPVAIAESDTSSNSRSGADGTMPADRACPFCPRELLRSKSPFDRILAKGPGLCLLPALGMLVPGYFLAITTEHIFAFSELSRPQLDTTETWLDSVISQLAPLFGEYLLFEHGSCGGSRTGACATEGGVS